MGCPPPPPLHRYGELLVLVASQELRNTWLTPADQDSPLEEYSDIQYGVLELAGACRHLGVPRPFITTYQQKDARSTFHNVKVLRLAGFVNVQVSQ